MDTLDRALLPLLAVARLVATLAEHAAPAVGLACDGTPSVLDAETAAGAAVLARPRGRFQRQAGLRRDGLPVQMRAFAGVLGGYRHLDSLGREEHGEQAGEEESGESHCGRWWAVWRWRAGMQRRM